MLDQVVLSLGAWDLMGQFVGTATIDNSQTEVVDISIMWENYGYLINIWK